MFRLALPALLIALFSTHASAFIQVTPKFSDQPVAASTFFGVLITALPFISTTSPEAGSDLSDALTEESSLDHKLVMAQDEAAAFVASAGSIRGVQLEAALEALRQLPELLPYDDLYLATAILARQSAGGR